MPPTTAPSLLTVREVAAEKRVTVQTVNRWIRLKRLPAQRVAGTQRWFIDPADLDAMTEKSL